MRPRPLPPAPGQEGVWDYPSPPRLEPVPDRIRIIFDGVTIADTGSAYRVLETSHPPVYYLPPQAFVAGSLVPTSGGSHCEWKGRAVYYDVASATRRVSRAGWGYPDPTPAFAAIRDFVAIYAGPMDACYVGADKVIPQPGLFYGGWITPTIVGPFKGEPGTMGW